MTESASFAVVTPVTLMPRGLYSVRAAAFRPFTNSRRTRCSSVRTRIGLTAFAITAYYYNGALETTDRTCLLHTFQCMREAALVAVAGISVQDAFRYVAVDDLLRLAHGLGRGVLVAGRHRLRDVLDRRADRGAQPHVVRAPLDCLAGALLGRLDVCHGEGAL